MMPFHIGAGGVDHAPCRYGRSRAVFRGPPRDISGRYVVVLGGSATFGRQIARPYPALLEGSLGCPVVNLGAQNAGPDFYLADPAVLDIAARAQLAVVQLGGAEAVSNPFYTVHARRNDRVLGVTPALRALFPQADFAEVHFARHLLSVLRQSDAERFQTVARVLQSTWQARMRDLLAHLPLRRVLLCLATGAADDDAAVAPIGRASDLAAPGLRGQASPVVTVSGVVLGGGVIAPDKASGVGLPDAAGHRQIAEALLPRIRPLLPVPPPPLVLGPAWALA